MKKKKENKKKSEKKRKKKNEKNEKREKKRVYIKKGGVRKEGSESELDSCTHVKGYLVHALKLWQYTSAEKTFRHLAPHNLALARLQSLAITLIRCQLCIASLAAPMHAKEEECSSYDPGLCYSTLIGTCS